MDCKAQTIPMPMLMLMFMFILYVQLTHSSYKCTKIVCTSMFILRNECLESSAPAHEHKPKSFWFDPHIFHVFVVIIVFMLKNEFHCFRKTPNNKMFSIVTVLDSFHTTFFFRMTILATFFLLHHKTKSESERWHNPAQVDQVQAKNNLQIEIGTQSCLWFIFRGIFVCTYYSFVCRF